MAGGATYAATRDRLEDYFDRTAAGAWEALTSDAPVSRIRQTVREGRARMREVLLALLPKDLSGKRVLDAGCGAGDLSVALAVRGAEVVGVDLAPAMLKVARKRAPRDAPITFLAGDMTDPDLGAFDHVVAMDSLIHYERADLIAALGRLGAMAPHVAFTVAPRTMMLSTMHALGKAFPKADRSPQIVPHPPRALMRAVPGLEARTPVAAGFYFSQAMEWRR
ncbi:MAG: magnesium protoporphyrin IX methyltransferase [Hasllibacter sp.]